MEGAHAQQLATPWTTRCQCFGEQLRTLPGKPDLTSSERKSGQPSGLVRAQCEFAPVFSTKRRTATEQKQSRIRKVATQARSGERGRALAAARNAPPVPVTQQIVQEIKCL